MWKRFRFSEEEELILKCIRENSVTSKFEDEVISISVGQKELLRSKEFKEATELASALFNLSSKSK